MNLISDFHIHSKYSGGTSNKISIQSISRNSNIKGIHLLGTGDCLHYKWLEELKKTLTTYSPGIFYYEKIPNVKFLLQTEIELIWKHNLELKKVHFVLLFPDYSILDQVHDFLSKYGNLDEDGRPKIYLDPEACFSNLKEISQIIEIIPAHILTPYFGILGSKSNFESMKEALGSSFRYINVIESGLSADPFMIRQLSELNNISIISNSDAHSTNFHRIGREATLINIKNITYTNVISAIKKTNKIRTFEFKPQAGKYFFNGHNKKKHLNRLHYCCSPTCIESRCPYCNETLTKGVLSRIYELRDQFFDYRENYQYILPLLELICKINGGTVYDKNNIQDYIELLSKNRGEYNIWNKRSNIDGCSPNLIKSINLIKNNKFFFTPGYDGVYGQLKFIRDNSFESKTSCAVI